MKLTEIKNEDALDVLANIIDPLCEIAADENVKKANKEGGKIAAVKYVLKNHKSAVMAVLAALDGVPVEEYSCNVLTLPAKILEILNDPEIMAVFDFAE